MTTREELEAYPVAFDAPSLGRLIRNTRILANLSQEELAEGIKASKSNLSYIEQGATLPTLLTLTRILTFLGCRWNIRLEKLMKSPRRLG